MIAGYFVTDTLLSLLCFVSFFLGIGARLVGISLRFFHDIFVTSPVCQEIKIS